MLAAALTTQVYTLNPSSTLYDRAGIEMIFGVFERAAGRPVDRDRFEAALGLLGEAGERASVFPDPSVALAYARPFRTAPYGGLGPAQSPGGKDAMVFSGKIYNRDEVTGLLAAPHR